MRVWDIQPKHLCRQHLLGQHREIHCILTILKENRKAYSHHPEVKRWKGKLGLLKLRHDATAREMRRRKYQHHTPFPHYKIPVFAYVKLWQSVGEQLDRLKEKGCKCFSF